MRKNPGLRSLSWRRIVLGLKPAAPSSMAVILSAGVLASTTAHACSARREGNTMAMVKTAKRLHALTQSASRLAQKPRRTTRKAPRRPKNQLSASLRKKSCYESWVHNLQSACLTCKKRPRP